MHVARAHIDFETASAADLRKTGVYPYAEHPSTRVWGFAWCLGDGPIYKWQPEGLFPDPTPLLSHIESGGVVVAHNAAFERTIWNKVIRRLYPHWPELKIEQQQCTMARAQALALPAGLDQLGNVLRFQEQKDKDGHGIMMRMSRPRKVEADGTYVWWDEPERVERLMDYCIQDVRTECEADRFLPELSQREQRLWQFDQTINDRGVFIDIAAVTRAADVVEIAKKRADLQMKMLTDGAVKKCSETAKIVEWIQSRGITCTTIAKGEQDDLLFVASVHGDDTVQRVIELRREASKTSTAKYAKMLDCVCEDNRMRGLLAYHSASTGRWAGRLVQPQNFPRVDAKRDGPTVAYTIRCLHEHDTLKDIHDLIDIGVGNVLGALSKSLRGMICAAPGNKLVGGDFSNIEGRVNAWLADEHWKTEAFCAFDAGTGPDLYKVAYSRSFGKPLEEVTDPDRQIGKVQELALGFQGGVGAFITMAATYNVKPHEIYKAVKANTSAEQWDATAKLFEKAKDKHGLKEEIWTALKIVVKGWRVAHSGIVSSWWSLGDAAVAAVDRPGTAQPVYNGRASYLCVNGWLYCQLPSGRVISYCSPEVVTSTETFIDKYGEEYERTKRTVWFWGLDSVTKTWRKSYLYPGLQCENIVQATARCLLDNAMLRVEEAGYSVVLTVHDEILTEVQRDFGNAQHFRDMMAVPPSWAQGLPVAVSAWEDERYVK